MKAVGIPTAGQGGNETLNFRPGPSECGAIEDGVSFMLDTLVGWWVISFASLEKIYLEAKKVREKGDCHESEALRI